MTLDVLIAEVGSFGVDRRRVRENLWDLAREGFLDYEPESGVYTLLPKTRAKLLGNEVKTSIAESRTVTWKPLDLSRLHNRSMRRESTLDKVNERTFTLSGAGYLK